MKRKILIIIVAFLFILSASCAVYGYLNKNKETSQTNINDNNIENKNINIIDNSTNTIVESDNDIYDNDRYLYDDTKQHLTKKDDDYEYSYYYDEEFDSIDGVDSFKIRGKEIIDSIEYITEVLSVKKYKDFIIVETNDQYSYVGKALYIYNYDAELLFSDSIYSIIDLKKLSEKDSEDRVRTGYVSYDSYTYDEENNKLEMKLIFNIYSTIGENAVGSIPDSSRPKIPFCVASKNKTLYKKITITSKYNNGKFENEEIIDKTEFNINDYNSDEKDLYYSICGKK